MRRTGVTALTCLLATHCLATAALGAPVTADRSLDVLMPSGLQYTPDGKRLVFEVSALTKGRDARSTQLWMVDLESLALKPLTTMGTENGEAAIAPDGKRLVFVSDRDGTSDLYLLDLVQGGDPRRLTELATGASGPIWSPDGKTIVFVTRVYADCKDLACNKARIEADRAVKVKPVVTETLPMRHWNRWRDGRTSHLYAIAADGGTPPRDLTPGTVEVPPLALNEGRGYDFWGSDRVVYAADTSARLALSTNGDIYVASLKGGAPKPLATGPAWEGSPVGGPDADTVAWLAMERPGFEADRTQLFVQQKGKARSLSKAFDFSIGELTFTHDAKTIYFDAYRDGAAELHKVDVATGTIERLLPGQTVGQLVTNQWGHVAFVGSRMNKLPEVYVYDPAVKRPRAITSLNAVLEQSLDLSPAERLEVKSADGASVHGFVLLPKKAKGARSPLVVLIHGGPQGAWMDAWMSRWNAQLFTSAGYVVAMPNIRGSVGYGQAFTDAISGDWAGLAYQDLQAFVAAVEARPEVNKGKKAALGASYGGYLVNWIAGHDTSYQALISHAGVFDLDAMWGETEELWFPEWELGGTPWTAKAAYERWSPHRYIQNAKTPLMVTQGQLDFRVPMSQGVMLFTSLDRLGVKTRFVSYPDEGHWILRPTNYVHWYGEMLGWLDRHLR